MVDYRAIPDERAVFHEYRNYAFAPTAGPAAYDPDEHDTPRALLGDPRGIYPDEETDGSEPRSVCRHYWFDARVRGDRHPTAGLAAVATPPEYRREGYVGHLLEHSLEEYRNRGNRFAVLWPFAYAFYRRYGWDTCNRVVTHECAPDDLAFATTADREGSFRRIDAEEYAALEPAYEAYAERFALSLVRKPDWWQYRLLEGHDTDPFVSVYERDGRARGYLVYTIEENAGRSQGMADRTMDVVELAYDDHADLLALLSFCHTHDSQVRRVRLRVPEAVPLLEVATDPDAFETTLETGPMGRIVDVADALSALSYPDVDATLELAVSDPVADWNDGRFSLTVTGGAGECEPATAAATGNVDARLDIGACSQLVVGYRSATDLERTGRLEVADESVLETLTALFPETDVYLGDRF